jgi:predicted SnoaL-like aldol condensation-catalyzing enzyme
MRTNSATASTLLVLSLVLGSTVLGCAPASAAEDSIRATQASSRGGRNDRSDRWGGGDRVGRANVGFVLEGVDAMFVDLDPSAVDRYLAPNYIEHDPLFADGLEPQRALITSLQQNAAFKYTHVRALGDGDYVAVHGQIEGFFPKPAAVFDLFRLENGMIAEHWDAIQQEGEPNPSGRTMLDGPTFVHEHRRTEENRALAIDLVHTAFIGGDVGAMGRFISPVTYLQHNPGLADGLGTVEQFFGQSLANGFRYTQLHHVIADGNFVLVHAEASANGAPTPIALFDLWRAEDGQLVEHWDVVQAVPATSKNQNGFF